jgi:hypothetical protein
VKVNRTSLLLQKGMSNISKLFLVQTINGQVKHDFSFGLLEAIDYYKWYYGNKNLQYNYILSDNPERPKLNDFQYYPLDEVIPIGTVEFVLEYLKKYYNINNIKPINIPEQLIKQEYTKRNVQIIQTTVPCYCAGNKELFIKSNDKIKGFSDFLKPYCECLCPEGEYLLSEVIEIESEWRAFVYKKELVGLQNYLGDFTMFPDVNLIEKMINDYSNCPPAYTLDVGINNNGTFIVECHVFFSCGLYGFSDYSVLPKMFVLAWNWLVRGYYDYIRVSKRITV